MKFFDLFCGVGGFRLGLERNGHKCIGSCEIDDNARATYAKNFGHEPEYKDARDIRPRELPNFDILAAGFPCQAFSVAGKLLGFKEARGTLFFEIARIAKAKRPQLLFLENVRNILSHDRGFTFKTILNTLDEIGYDCQWILINSKFFVPQNRERVYIIGHLRNGSPRKIFPIGTSDTVNIETRSEA
jgi:DNA (cytosine-5)-methyltransferase 1